MGATRYCPHCQALRPTTESVHRAEPIVRCTACTYSLPDAPPAPPSAPPKVLCIDSDPSVRQFVTDTLPAHGFAPLTAPDGLTGLALAAAERPRVILVEAALPRLDGFEVCRLLRGDEVLRTSAVILAGPASARLAGRAAQAGADLALAKPFQPLPFVATLRTVLALKAQRLRL